MPIRAEHRQFYSVRSGWRKFRLQLIEAAGGPICKDCGAKTELINASHDTHDPRDRRTVVLRCPACHARHDAPHRIAIMRRNRAEETGQLWLMPELEWAPYASWEIPGWVYDQIVQLRLFA